MDAVASTDVDQLRAAAALAVPDSPASVYVAHLGNVNEAELDGGSSIDPQEASQSGDTYEICSTDDSCLTYSEFSQDGAGLVSRFRINDTDVAPLLSQGDGNAVRTAGAKFTFLTSYRSVASKAVFVTVKVETGTKPLDLNIYTATYRDPTGKQREATTAGGPTELAADSNALIYSAFVGVRPGGTMTLDGCVDKCNSTYKVRIRTR